MRLWHYELIHFLPSSQLLAQKRECDLIWKDIAHGKKTNHILINYIWEYKDYVKELSIYYWLLKNEFDKRGFNFNISENFVGKNNFYSKDYKPFAKHHNTRYLIQCFHNLQEKYDRKQKDFDIATYSVMFDYMADKLCDFLKGE